jgi:tetratricopeptide (TPR) repeat protein
MSQPTLSSLETQAVAAAKNQDWTQAIDVNRVILEEHPNDLGALNRLGLAYLQSGEKKKAIEAFEQVLELDKSNQIAKKNLQKIKADQPIQLPTLSSSDQFIEEPGKTKIVDLHRLAGKNVLEKIAVGKSCELKCKSRYISVEVDGQYVGSLPEDLSSRLSGLINAGNKYSCVIRSVSGTACSVFLKEEFRAKSQQFVNSFPAAKPANALSEAFMLDTDVPIQLEEVQLQVVFTDTDEVNENLDSIDDIEEEQPEEPLPSDDGDE